VEKRQLWSDLVTNTELDAEGVAATGIRNLFPASIAGIAPQGARE
jgi:hypothetical protein